MYIKQLYTKCISKAAYYIESNGEAAVIDPFRDADEYVTLAKERNAVIKFIFETHFHADFVSGHLDLSKATGAPIIYGPETETKYPVTVAKNAQRFLLGITSIEVLHTPGHTLESSSYLWRDETGKPHSIFTGDTLFAGDIGRPDLSSGNLDKDELAGILYDTIQNKILPLEDEIIVYPSHVAGGSNGKTPGYRTFSTIGDEKKNNFALQPQSKEDFIKAVSDDLTDVPKYFSINSEINKNGYESLDAIKNKAMKALTVKMFKNEMEKDVTVLDTRNAKLFTEGFVPGSVSIGLEGRFAEWAGSLLPFDKTILLITELGMEEETVTRLARVGFSKMEGYLKGGFAAWEKAGENVDLIINVEADELAMDIPFDDHLQVVDVRRETEFAEGHVKGAINLPLTDLTNIALIAGLEENQNLYVHCAGGYRSVIASSILKKEGIHNLRNVVGGWDKIKEEKKIKIEIDASVLN